MPMLYAAIAKWVKDGWKVRSKAGGKSLYMQIIDLCFEKGVVQNKKTRKCIRTQDIYKVYFLVTSSSLCYVVICDENFEADIAWIFLNKLDKECSETNKKYLKLQFEYFNKTNPEKIRTTFKKLNSFADDLGKDIDDDEEDPLKQLDIKKVLKNIRGEATGKCSVM